jgi:hypothetical protein
MVQKTFHKLPRSLLTTTGVHRLFELVAKAIAIQVEDAPFRENLGRLAETPVEAQTIYWLWRFQCEAGGDGFEGFILQALGIHGECNFSSVN